MADEWDMSGTEEWDMSGSEEWDMSGSEEWDMSGSEDWDMSGSDEWDMGGAKSEDYSALRSGVVNLVESATGYGTELDALVRRVTGDADSFDEAHRQSMADIATLEAEDKYVNYLTTGVGFAAGFLIPGAAFAKVGKVADAAAKSKAMWTAGLIGGAEGAAYGFGTGHTLEERGTGALIGAGLGGAATGALGKWVIKSDEELAAAALSASKRKGRGTFIGGEEGFNRVETAKAPSSAQHMIDTSSQDKGIKAIDDAAEELTPDEGAYGTIKEAIRGMRSWNEKHVSARFGKLADDAEQMGRRGRTEIDKSMTDTPEMIQVNERLAASPGLKNILVRVNPDLKDGSRLDWDGALALATDPADKQALKSLRNYVRELQIKDPANMKVDADGVVKWEVTDYFPTKALGKIRNKGGAARTDQYDDPMEAIREYAYDINDASEMARRFFGDKIEMGDDSWMRDVIVKSNGKVSRTEAVIQAIGKRIVKDIDGPDAKQVSDRARSVQNNAINGLRTQFVAARQGGNAIGSVMRRATSTALLANPLNAVLNMVEGITAPIYQNGIAAWMETVPDAIVSTFRPKGLNLSKGYLDDMTSGHGGQYMGELANTGKAAFDDTARDLAVFGGLTSDRLSGGVDALGKVMYKVSGVDTVNRMGREILSNSALKRGGKLALKGDEKSIAKLMKHDGMRGLSEVESKATIRALKKFREDPASLSQKQKDYVMNFAGSSLNKWQPVSASSMPKIFHDNPNGRMLYSMLSYMNRQMNNITDDIGIKFQQAAEAGLNTPEGQKLMREAYSNGAKYAGLFGVLAGTWNTARMGLDPSKDKPFMEVFTPEGMAEAATADLVSNMTMGLLNIRAPAYGKKVGSIESMIPAPLSAVGNMASGVIKGVGEMAEGERPDSLLGAVQNYVPGVSNVDRMYRMGTGERLLTDDGSGKGYITGNGALDQGMLYDLINQ